MIGKVDRVDNLEFGSTWRPLFASRISATYVDIVAQALEGKDSGLASYISVGDMRLYAEHPLIHGLTLQRRERKLPIGRISVSSDRSNASQPKRWQKLERKLKINALNVVDARLWGFISVSPQKRKREPANRTYVSPCGHMSAHNYPKCSLTLRRSHRPRPRRP